MKKIISSVVAMFLTIILFTTVSAVEVSTDTIAPGSYLIGTYLFDREGSSSYDGTLTVRHIMLASKTIPGNTIEDMQILYNRARDGVWVDAITNEEVEMPAKINIEHKNLEQILEVPYLVQRSQNGNLYHFEILVENITLIAGYELYEQRGEELILIGDYNPTEKADVIINNNDYEEKTFVARTFAYNKANQKVYSFYSNEIVLKHILPAPTLATGLGGFGATDLNIIEMGAYGYEEMWNAIDGYELYEKNGEELTLIGEYEPTEVAEVAAAPHESRVIVARVFVYNSKNEKVYSDYSNEYVVENTLPAPTLAAGLGGFGTTDLNIIEGGAYGYEDMWNAIDGFELYEKDGEKLTLVDEYEPTGVAIVMAQPGETKTYVARVFVYYNENEKVYSDYSNEFVVENTLPAPTLAPAIPNVVIGIVQDGSYGYEDMWNAIDGYELYEKDGEELTLIDEYEPTEGATVRVGLGETKTYVARVFVYYNENEKVYSDYSNEYTITNTATAALGDIDNDGIVDENDAYLLEDYLFEYDELDAQGLKNADMNGDGVVNDDDYPILIQYLVDGNDLPFYEPKENVIKIEYYVFKESINEYLISVPEGVEIDWDGEYHFSDNSVIYDKDLFRLPPEFDELPRFEGWYLDEEGTTEVKEIQSLTGTIKLYAKFDTELIIKYDGNGATSGEMLDSVHIIGETSNLSKNTYVRTGYKFVGWAGETEDYDIVASDEDEVEVPLWFLAEAKTPFTLYAVWEKEVVYGDINGDSEINVQDAAKILRHIMDLEELTEEQLFAADVNLDEEVDYVDYQIVLKRAASLIEALPYDSGEKYTISYNVDGGEGELGIELLQTEYAEVSLPMALPNLVKQGYVFKGWTGSNGDIPEKTVIIPAGTTGDLEYTANWELAE